MKADLLTSGFLLIVLGIGLGLWWARKARADREAAIGRLVGGGG
jgi:hypothetical protein